MGVCVWVCGVNALTFGTQLDLIACICMWVGSKPSLLTVFLAVLVFRAESRSIRRSYIVEGCDGRFSACLAN
jgi:hypothetical protein